jgi:hypothetical protein
MRRHGGVRADANSMDPVIERTKSPPELSVIVSEPGDEYSLSRLFDDLGQLALSHEIIIVDSGASPGLAEKIPPGRARVVNASGGRAAQFAAGIEAAESPFLFLIYGGVRLRFHALRALERVVRMGRPGAHVFRIRIDGSGTRYRFLEWQSTLRSRVTGAARGYQGLVVRRSDLEAAGGYPKTSEGADISVVRALRDIVDIRLLSVAITVPANLIDDGA